MVLRMMKSRKWMMVGKDMRFPPFKYRGWVIKKYIFQDVTNTTVRKATK